MARRDQCIIWLCVNDLNKERWFLSLAPFTSPFPTPSFSHLPTCENRNFELSLVLPTHTDTIDKKTLVTSSWIIWNWQPCVLCVNVKISDCNHLRKKRRTLGNSGCLQACVYFCTDVTHSNTWVEVICLTLLLHRLMTAKLTNNLIYWHQRNPMRTSEFSVTLFHLLSCLVWLVFVGGGEASN